MDSASTCKYRSNNSYFSAGFMFGLSWEKKAFSECELKLSKAQTTVLFCIAHKLFFQRQPEISQERVLSNKHIVERAVVGMDVFPLTLV